MENILIRKVQPTEATQLQQISKDSFYEAFAAANSEADMQQYMEQSFSAARLQEELNNPLSDFYFAMEGSKVIGYLKLNRGAAQTELKEAAGLEIERIYVLQPWLGKKVGQQLYEQAPAVAAEMQAAYIWLAVWEENERAIKFYSKNGFVAFDKHAFLLGTDEQTDIMMKKKL